MSIIKHKLFEIGITENDNYHFDVEALKKIDEFLLESNFVYVNHSITTLGKDLRTSHYREVCLIISLVYKDLNDSPDQLTNVSKKSKKIVRESIEDGDILPSPSHKSTFDKKVENIPKFDSKPKKQ